jgi:hypothetical protein
MRRARERRLGIDLYSLTARERIFKMFIYNGGGVHLSIKLPIAQILDSNHISIKIYLVRNSALILQQGMLHLSTGVEPPAHASKHPY